MPTIDIIGSIKVTAQKPQKKVLGSITDNSFMLRQRLFITTSM